MSSGWRWTSDKDGIHVEEITDADPAEVEQREMRHRFNLTEADELLSSMPSSPVEFARWYLETDDGSQP